MDEFIRLILGESADGEQHTEQQAQANKVGKKDRRPKWLAVEKPRTEVPDVENPWAEQGQQQEEHPEKPAQSKANADRREPDITLNQALSIFNFLDSKETIDTNLINSARLNPDAVRWFASIIRHSDPVPPSDDKVVDNVIRFVTKFCRTQYIDYLIGCADAVSRGSYDLNNPLLAKTPILKYAAEASYIVEENFKKSKKTQPQEETEEQDSDVSVKDILGYLYELVSDVARNLSLK